MDVTTALSPQALLGDIIAGIVQVLPLILIPLILKGMLDSVPLVGKAAQNLMNRGTKAAGNYGNSETGFFGRRRAEYMNNQRNLFGQKLNEDQRANTRTFGNRYQSYKHARSEQLKSIVGQGEKDMEQRVLDGDTSYSSQIARNAHHALEDQGIQGADIEQGFKEQLATRRVTDDKLVTMDQRTRARALAERTALDQGQQNFTTALRDNENGLLDIAEGTVDPVAGRVRAQAAAVSAGFDVDDQGIKNQKALLTQELTDIQKRGPTYKTNADGSFVMKNGERVVDKSAARLAQDHLEDQLGSSDFYQMAAARDILMTQGSSGVDAFRRKYTELEKSGHFSANKEMQDLQVAFSRNTVSTHGQALKAKSKDFLNAFTKGQSVEAAAADAATWKGQNDDELSGGTTSYLLRGIASGGISAKRAAAILSDDVIRNKFDQEKVQILQVLKDGGDVEGKAAVEQIWDLNTAKVKSRPDSGTVSLGDSDDTIKISSVVVPGIPVPAAGSPTGTFKDYIDKASGVSRLDRDDFVKLQQNVAYTESKADDDDMKNIRASIDAEIRRRNDESASVNQAVGSQVYSTISPVINVDRIPESEARFATTSQGTTYDIPRERTEAQQRNQPAPAQSQQREPYTFTPVPTANLSYSQIRDFLNRNGGLSNATNNNFNIIVNSAANSADTSPEMTQLINDIAQEQQSRSNGSSSN